MLHSFVIHSYFVHKIRYIYYAKERKKEVMLLLLCAKYKYNMQLDEFKQISYIITT